MALQLQPVDAISADLRGAYLDSLTEPQEFYVENRVARSRAFLILRDGETLGYALIDDATIVEFYLHDDALRHGAEAFQAALDMGGATGASCKTFDPIMMALAASRPASVELGGLLFRRTLDSDFSADPSIRPRLGRLSDTPAILDVNGDSFFRGANEIASYVNVDGLFVYEAPDGALLGCGVAMRVVAGRDAIDIGMMTAPAHKRRGVGAHIVRHLKARCLAQGLRPVCGCAAANVASRRTLERAGFVCSHAILEFTY